MHEHCKRGPAPNLLVLSRAGAVPARVSSGKPKKSRDCALRDRNEAEVRQSVADRAHEPVCHALTALRPRLRLSTRSLATFSACPSSPALGPRPLAKQRVD